MKTTTSKNFLGTFRPMGPCLNIALAACYLTLVIILTLYYFLFLSIIKWKRTIKWTIKTLTKSTWKHPIISNPLIMSSVESFPHVNTAVLHLSPPLLFFRMYSIVLWIFLQVLSLFLSCYWPTISFSIVTLHWSGRLWLWALLKQLNRRGV